MSPRRTFIGFLFSLALCGSTSAFADPPQASSDQSQQTSNNTETPKTLGTIVVTGTHIRGVDLETEHPVQVLKREDLLRTGLTGVADIVQSLIVASGQTRNRNINNGNDGRQLVNLRSLGAGRWSTASASCRRSTVRWFFSVIPLVLVQRIEVLKDGASAIYGADASGGGL